MLIHLAADLFNLPRPTVRVHYKQSLSWQQEDVISLQGIGKHGYASGGMNAATCCHEVAHYIQWKTYPRTTDHGRRFAGIYRYMLNYFSVLPQRVIAEEWKEYGIQWRN
jgi:hypothetical protein